MNTPNNTPLRHGYTMTDLDILARISVATAFARAMDYVDRYDAAWHGIAEHLVLADTAPTRADLKHAGTKAINDAAQDHFHTWGMARGKTVGTGGSMAAFQRYWDLSRRSTSSPEDMVVDQAALRQIWPELSSLHQRVLLAMATHGDYGLAAEACGKSRATFASHLKNARRAFFELWHEHETPSRLWGRTDRVSGRRTAAQTLVNRRQQRARRAAKAAAEAGSPTVLSRRVPSAWRYSSLTAA